MVNVKSKVLKIRNLPTDGKKLDEITSKPYPFIFVCLSIGCLLIFTKVLLFAIFGVLIDMFFLYYLTGVKNITLIEFYDKYVVFYLNNGQEECYLIFWEDVEQYSITSQRNDLDTLNIIFRDGKCVALKCLGKKKIEHYFMQNINSIEEESSTKQHA